MTPTFIVSIAHAAHREERRAAHRRLTLALDREGLPYVTASTPGNYDVWSLEQWRLALEWNESGMGDRCTHAVFLNDDVTLCDGFHATLKAAVAAQPESLINLYNNHCLAVEADRRDLRWLTSRDGLLGPAYIMPIPMLHDFLGWRATALVDGATKRLTEDQLVNLYAMSRGLYTWHTVPSLCDHDTSLTTNYSHLGNKPHRAMVGPRTPMPTEWKTDAIHIGRVFTGNHWALLTQIKPEQWREHRLVERAYEIHTDYCPTSKESA